MKKILAATLLAAIISASFASCGSAGTVSETAAPSDTQTSAAGDSSTEAESSNETTETEVETLDLPDADYNGYEFRVLAHERGDSGTWFQYMDFETSSDLAGDLINDAVFQRNSVVEEKYNVTISTIPVSDVAGSAQKSITAGSDDFDIAEPFIDKALNMASEGLMLNLYDIPHLSLEKSWWDYAIQRDLSICGKLFAVTGDISMFDEELSYCINMNKAVAEKYGVTDCYQLVRDGAWTLDKLTEYGRLVTTDVNGDGTMDENDAYGVLTDYSLATVWFFAFGGQMATVDADGAPILLMGDEHNAAVAEKLGEFFTDTSVVLNATKTNGDWKTFDVIFTDDRTLFRQGNIYAIPRYRNMVSDFGVLPYPKLDEAQEQYYHFIATWVCQAISVPVTNTDTDRTGLLLEALAYGSRDTVTEAYYETSLKTKYSRDEETAEMLDVIFAAKRYDLARSFNWGGFNDMLISVAQNPGTFASAFSTREQKALSEMSDTYAGFSKN